MESRFQRLQEEGDRLAEQIVSLVAMRDNLKRELKDAVKLTEQLQEDVLAKETEAEGWRREKEKMIKEIQDLQDDLETRRQEVHSNIQHIILHDNRAYVCNITPWLTPHFN